VPVVEGVDREDAEQKVWSIAKATPNGCRRTDDDTKATAGMALPVGSSVVYSQVPARNVESVGHRLGLVEMLVNNAIEPSPPTPLGTLTRWISPLRSMVFDFGLARELPDRCNERGWHLIWGSSVYQQLGFVKCRICPTSIRCGNGSTSEASQIEVMIPSGLLHHPMTALWASEAARKDSVSTLVALTFGLCRERVKSGCK
jgi:hypothetical protein